MPKYKDSPEVRAARKERKEKLREFLQLLDVEDYSDLRPVFKEMVGEVLENGLEAELDDELGYDYRNKNTENSRNGYSRKSVKTSAGSVEIADKVLNSHSVLCIQLINIYPGIYQYLRQFHRLLHNVLGARK